jgi:catechol 2,3-dioxygenase-like lactoylglutathione lyase family enzyme
MQLSMRRIVLFTGDMPRMLAFYRDLLGLALVADEPGWKELDAGSCRIALHRGKSRIGARAPKSGFWASDVAAARTALIDRGAKLGKLIVAQGLTRCDGKDPDGNAFSVSDRR